MQGQVVDTESAREFMQEARKQISADDLAAIAGECAAKSERFQGWFSPGRAASVGPDELDEALAAIFATRRRRREILAAHPAATLGGWIAELLAPARPIAERFDAFVARLAGVPETVSSDLAGELLHFTDPERYWLWTRWMWDPRVRTGALPLVTMEEVDLSGATPGETYARVGEAVAFVRATGDAAGFTRASDGPFALDVFLASVYGVYMYTTLRMRMTQEFNKVVPALPELCRRLLGVHAPARA
ncbi:MAG: hypothetical protein HY729_07630 [Candidatus Rokubacteria bacterium]|nr:hypothetical protein [Candidatus Rokubacteria bacterium]MBI4628563.1 hypothetical protein [Candidatus Rokubacteria bacterium]